MTFIKMLILFLFMKMIKNNEKKLSYAIKVFNQVLKVTKSEKLSKENLGGFSFFLIVKTIDRTKF